MPDAKIGLRPRPVERRLPEPELHVKAHAARDLLHRMVDEAIHAAHEIADTLRGEEGTHKDFGHEVIIRYLAEVGEHKVKRPLLDSGDMTICIVPLVSKLELRRLRDGAKENA